MTIDTNLELVVSVYKITSLKTVVRINGATYVKDYVQVRDQTSANVVSRSIDRIMTKSKMSRKR